MRFRVGEVEFIYHRFLTSGFEDSWFVFVLQAFSRHRWDFSLYLKENLF